MTNSLTSCTALLADKKPCKRDSDARYQRGVKVNGRRVHDKPICQSCYKEFRKSVKPCKFDGCKVEAQSTLGYCRPHEHVPLLDLTMDERSRLWQLIADSVEPDHEVTGCWTFTGFTEDGYSRLSLGTSIKRGLGTWLGHRLTYHLIYHGHAQGRELDHLCNNSLCINPLHLHAVTQKENKRLRNRRARDPWAPWYEHSNFNVLTFALMYYSSLHGLPTWPWRETHNDDGSISYSMRADKDPENIAEFLYHLDGSYGRDCAGTDKTCCRR